MSHITTIRRFLVEAFLPDVHESEVADDLDLIENGVIDSLGLLQVIAWLESRFQVSIDVADMVPENFCSVGAIAALLSQAQMPVAVQAGE